MTRARVRVRWDNGHEASVEDRQLGALTVENRRQLGDGDMGTSVEDDDNEVVLGGGFNMNHGSLAAVLSY